MSIVNSKDSLGDRMKCYEARQQLELQRRCYTMIRIDGRAFHTYTRGFKRPFDDAFRHDMQQTALHLCKEIQGAVMALVQSDEIQIVLTDFAEKNTDAWFDGNVQKITSISASMATAKFNRLRMERVINFADDDAVGTALIAMKMAEFDSRCWTLSDPWDVYNVFLWRQQDASRNAIQMVARALASHKECDKLNMSKLQDLIHERGQNFNDYPTDCKRGAFIHKGGPDDKFIVDKEAPILTQDRDWFFSKLPMIEPVYTSTGDDE